MRGCIDICVVGENDGRNKGGIGKERRVRCEASLIPKTDAVQLSVRRDELDG